MWVAIFSFFVLCLLLIAAVLMIFALKDEHRLYVDDAVELERVKKLLRLGEKEQAQIESLMDTYDD